MYTLLLALAGEGIHTGTSTAQSVGVSGSGQVSSQEVCHPVSVHCCTDTKLRTVLLSVHSLCSQWYTFLRCLATCQLSQEVLVIPFNWKYCKCLQPVHVLTVYTQMMQHAYIDNVLCACNIYIKYIYVFVITCWPLIIVIPCMVCIIYSATCTVHICST